MSRKIDFSIGEYYHLYNRGVEKRIIFENDSDYKRFAILLYLCNSTSPLQFDHLPEWRGSTSPEFIQAVFAQEKTENVVSIGAFCLMPNHFHLLVREIKEGGISEFMHRLSTSYTMYFNCGRSRTGALFQGRFKAEHANTDQYLKYLYSYINLNPVKLIQPDWMKKGISNIPEVKKYLSSYPYSSYLDYTGSQREFSKILHIEQFPDYFEKRSDFLEEVEGWLTYNPYTG